MTAAVAPTRGQRAGEHLRLLQALSLELEKAIHAIACDDLATLTSSIACQDEMSEQLNRLADALATSQSGPAAEPLDQDLKRQLLESSQQLDQLNLRYSLLLKHSSRSVAMMATLFRSFSGEIQEEVADKDQRQQTWSCRI